MSTRSLIAVPDAAHGWVAVYHHSDGYPAGMGVYLNRILGAYRGDVTAIRRDIIDGHAAGWSHLYPSAFHPDQGEREVETPVCYCHGGRTEAPMLIYGDQPLDTDCEWLYLITPDGMVTYGITSECIETSIRQRVPGPNPNSLEYWQRRHGIQTKDTKYHYVTKVKRTWVSRLGNPIYDLRAAVLAEYDGDAESDGYKAFLAREGWAWTTEMPPFAPREV